MPPTTFLAAAALSPPSSDSSRCRRSTRTIIDTVHPSQSIPPSCSLLHLGAASHFPHQIRPVPCPLICRALPPPPSKPTAASISQHHHHGLQFQSVTAAITLFPPCS
ncbi:hypothetical protein M0R45_015474 [Rubus argutus]|uniref:Uncharacterized protein n=1 Tax=Rubus argutus TaxID=59490 RepID=A0AAW1XPT9_RUBAR